MKGIDSPSLDPLEAGKRGKMCLLPSFVNENKICQLQGRLPSNVPAHGKQTNMRTLCFFRWWGAPRRAGSLKPYEKYLAEFGWALCLNDAEDLFSLARLGTPKAGLTTQLFVLHAGLLILVGQNCADNGYVHEYCSRTCFEGCEI